MVIDSRNLLSKMSKLVAQPSSQQVYEYAVDLVHDLPFVSKAKICTSEGIIYGHSNSSKCLHFRQYLIEHEKRVYGILYVEFCELESENSEGIIGDIINILGFKLSESFRQANQVTKYQSQDRDPEHYSVKEELDITTKRYELALKASGMGVWDWDILKDTLTWDEQMYRLYGIESGQFSSCYDAWASIVHPDDFEEAKRSMQQALQKETQFNCQFRIVWPTGAVRVLSSIADIVYRDEVPVRMIGVNWDVTEVQRHVRDLESTNKELGKFAYVVAHDFQAPLRHILAFVSLLKEKHQNFDEESSDWLTRVCDSAERMQHLIRDLLSYSRVGRTTAEPTKVDLASLLQQIKEDFQTNTKLELTISNLPTYQGHQDHLRCLFKNLIENSISYAKPSSIPRICVTAEDMLDRVVLRVQDDGIGIEPRFHDKIFEMFQTLSSRAKGSTGIGLAICQKVAELHGGTIHVESQKNCGATFVVVLRKLSASKIRLAQARLDGYVGMSDDRV